MNEDQIQFASKNFTVGIFVFCEKCGVIIYTSPDMTDFSLKNKEIEKHLEKKHKIKGDKK